MSANEQLPYGTGGSAGGFHGVSAGSQAPASPEAPQAGGIAVEPNGKLTTEFVTSISTIAGIIVSVLVMLGKVAPDGADAVTQTIVNGVLAAVGLGSCVVIAWRYLHSRAAVKVAFLEALSSVKVAQINNNVNTVNVPQDQRISV